MYQGWITHTWNPLGGKCPHGCSYCSTNKFYYQNLIDKYSGPPRLIEKELETNLGSGNYIFVCAQADLFAEDINPKWVIKILQHCEKYSNKYLYQTKNPKGFLDYGANIASTDNDFALCTTIETNRFYKEFMGNTPDPHKRAIYMSEIPLLEKYVTIEPIMDFDLNDLVKIIRYCKPKQVNIGADSGKNNLPEPDGDKIRELIFRLEEYTIVKQKSNLKRLL